MAVGVAWRAGDRWQRLAEFSRGQSRHPMVTVTRTMPNDVRFSVRYEVGRTNVRAVLENYQLTSAEVRVNVEVEGTTPSLRVCFPALAFDGASATRIAMTNATATVSLGSDRQVFAAEFPRGAKLVASGSPVRSRNGFLQAIEAEISGNRVTYSLRPEHLPAPK